MENVEVDRVLKVSFFALPITYKKYNILFPNKVYDFLLFSSMENFSNFKKYNILFPCKIYDFLHFRVRRIFNFFRKKASPKARFCEKVCSSMGL